MSQIYRSIAASTKTVSQALAIAGVVTLAIVIYTGFVSECTSNPFPRPSLTVYQSHVLSCTLGSNGYPGLTQLHMHSKVFSSTNFTANNLLAQPSFPLDLVIFSPEIISSVLLPALSLVRPPSPEMPIWNLNSNTPTLTSGATWASCSHS